MAQMTFPVSNMPQAKSSVAADLPPIALTSLSHEEVRPMYRQHYLPTTGRPAVAAPRRRWSRRTRAAAPAGGLAGAVPSADHGPTHGLLDTAVVSSGAADERLDVKAGLDQGRRLLSFQARFHAGDYDLAGPAGVSHQPLAEVFAPPAAWLTA